jgi:transposase
MNQLRETCVLAGMSNNHQTQQSLPLQHEPTDGRTFINASLWMVDEDGHRVIFLRHEPIYRIALGDEVHLRMVAVNLRLSTLASQEKIAKAFGHSVATQRRWETRYQEQNIKGLQRKHNPGRPPTLDATQVALVRRWFAQGVSNKEIGRRVAMDESSIRKMLKRLGLRREGRQEQRLPGVAEDGSEAGTAETPSVDISITPSQKRNDTTEPFVVENREEVPSPGQLATVPVGPSIDHDPLNRIGDRTMARLGLLEDAVPLFAEAEMLPRAGVLLAVPLLVNHGLLDVFQGVFSSLAPAFYGLRTTVVTLFLCALLRIKRPEELKEHRPQDLGRIVGLDRMPEVKTVRRKLSRLAAYKRGKQLMEKLARRRITEDLKRVAFLYVDGHVREYRGKHRLAKAKKPQRQVVTAAATDYWVHDAAGEPLLVVTTEMNGALTQVLEPILQDVKRLIPPEQRITVIFDRGGFSPKLFHRMIDQGFDVITYRKGKTRKLPESAFERQRQKIDGQWRECEFCDRPRVRVGRIRPSAKKRRKGSQYLWLREVRVLREDGRQTPILTNRVDLNAVEVAYRIFNRWRQENYFKYMQEEFALDGLVEYGAEEVSEDMDRPNPDWAKLTRRLKKTRAEVERLRAELGSEAACNEERTRPTMRGFKIAHAELREQLKHAEAQVRKLFQKRKTIAKRIPANDLEVLKTERKLIVDAIKMSAYQVETELLGMLQEHYARTSDEGRTLLSAAFQSSARLEMAGGELRVTIAAQASPHRTAALAVLCQELDAKPVLFPGTNLRLRLAVSPHEPLT